MPQPILVAEEKSQTDRPPQHAVRHDLIGAASRTARLQRSAEVSFCIGALVSMTDVKGDLAGISRAGDLIARLQERFKALDLAPPFKKKQP